MSDETEQTTVTPVTPPTRDEIRAKILNTKAQGKEGTLNGAKVELRESSLSTVLDFQQSGGEDRKHMAAKMLVDYLYIPGTDIKVFEEEDIEALLELPFNKDLRVLTEQITALLGVEPKAEDKSPDQV